MPRIVLSFIHQPAVKAVSVGACARQSTQAWFRKVLFNQGVDKSELIPNGEFVSIHRTKSNTKINVNRFVQPTSSNQEFVS